MLLQNLPADSGNGGGIGNQFINGGSLIDAVVISLGLLGNY